MSGVATVAIDLVVILLLVGGIALFRSPRTARGGNALAMAALAVAIGSVFLRGSLDRGALVAVALVIGAAVGLIVAVKVNMIQIPAMVAFQHGAGGLAALLVSMVEVWRGLGGELGAFQVSAGLVGMLIGAATFSASLVAGGKLAGVLAPKPTELPRHTLLTVTLLAASLVVAVVAVVAGGAAVLPLLVLGAAIACVAGVVLAVRIGGADMPVLISFLNATAGFAAAFCGVTIGSRLLVVCGATVAASGSVLTHVMCTSMNRRLVTVLVPAAQAGAGGDDLALQTGVVADEMAVDLTGSGASTVPAPGDAWAAVPVEAMAPVSAEASLEAPAEAPAGGPVEASLDAPADDEPADGADAYEQAAALLRQAERIVIIPGYGMASAQAQFEVVALSRHLEDAGKDVKFAIHPVAGRMPGHMHVLLAEADVSYDKLYEMNQINDQFKTTDVAVVIGACDVVNPAAMCQQNCPISGMPILRADEAAHVLVCNFDDRPGYSGVPNPLYEDPKTIMLLGDAKETVQRIAQLLREPEPALV